MGIELNPLRSPATGHCTAPPTRDIGKQSSKHEIWVSHHHWYPWNLYQQNQPHRCRDISPRLEKSSFLRACFVLFLIIPNNPAIPTPLRPPSLLPNFPAIFPGTMANPNPIPIPSPILFSSLLFFLLYSTNCVGSPVLVIESNRLGCAARSVGRDFGGKGDVR